MGIKAVIFDLDNTLFNEHQYVRSGFEAVSKHLAKKFEIDKDEMYHSLLDIFLKQGRSRVFDKLLMKLDLYNRDTVLEMVEVYRNHTPNIELYEDAQEVLTEIKKEHRIGLITDGIKRVQVRKVQTLGIENFLDVTVYAVEHGGKGNAQTFVAALKELRVKPVECVYVDDDPLKGFAIPRKLGMHTVRILKGEHKDFKVDEQFETQYNIQSLRQLLSVLKSFQQG